MSPKQSIQYLEIKICTFDFNSCKKPIGNEILERIGNYCVNKYFKFVGLKLDEFLNWDFIGTVKKLNCLTQRDAS